MQFFSRATGAGISALGAVLVLCGTLLPTYGSGDYEPAAFQKAPVVLLALLVAPALLVLVSSVLAWFHHLPRWLVVLCLVIIIPAFVLHLLGSQLAAAFACFDVCPPGGVHLGTGFWLPLVGFPLSAIGLAVAAATEKRRSLPGPPAASP
jgi:predicted tellurium resistance membrane protein TerC